jgi:hypothetical protein
MCYQEGVTHVTFTFVFPFDRNFKILILWNSGRDRLVTTAMSAVLTSLNPVVTCIDHYTLRNA